jgi:cyclic pyranopterin phosphate synthase
MLNTETNQPPPMQRSKDHMPMAEFPALVDQFGRVHNNLRISVTDRCNIRCFYCMPNEDVQFRPRAELLTNDEFFRFVRALSRCGVNRLRITGGEPLVRDDLCELIERLASIPGIDDIALTTNGILLERYAIPLRQAGLQRINISLDTLSEEVFQQISRRTGLQRVLDGIAAAMRVGFEKIRLNAIAIRGLSETEIVPLAAFARAHQLELRFIEFMPLDAENRWQSDKVLSGAAIRQILETEFGPLTPIRRDDPSQPAVDFEFADGRSKIGFINPVSEPFCSQCNRLRVTADGQVRNCLFSQVEWDVRQILRAGADDAAVIELVRQSIAQKKAGHGIDDPDFIKPVRAMYQIGG